MGKETGKFNLVGTGIVGVLALVAIGGGVFAFSSPRNQSSPSINVEGSTATGGSASSTGGSSEGGSAISGNTMIEQGSDAQSSTDSPTTPVNSSTEPDNASESGLSLDADNLELALKYPIYQDKDGACKLVGHSSVVLEKRGDGQFYYRGDLNGYAGGGTIQGTAMPSGKINLSLSEGNANRRIVTMEAEISGGISDIISVSGKSSSVDCPDSNFEATISSKAG
jgi:hypothetical protein